MMIKPPKLARRFLYWHCDPALLEEIEGDLNEEFEEMYRDKGAWKARSFYLLEVVRFLRMYKPKKKLKTLNNLDMIVNHLKMGLRTMKKHKAYSAINLLGLVIGISCSFLIFLYVKAESSFDKFHDKSDQIYRIQHSYSFMNAQAGPTYKEKFPEVEDYTRIYPWLNDTKVTAPSQDEYFDDLFIADKNFLEVFSFKLVEGNRATALDGPDKAVITESMAQKYFPSENALGKPLKITGWRGKEYNVQVSAIMEDVPFNSHLKFDILLPFQLLEDDPAVTIMDSWVNDWVATYFVIDRNADIKKLEDAYNPIWEEATALEATGTIRLMPLEKAHLHSHYLDVDFAPHGDINQVRIFTAVSVMILLIACINFMNLATARASKRSKEVGVRKVMGAYRRQLIVQFLSEAFLITSIASVISGLLVFGFVPVLENATNLELSHYFENAWLLVATFLSIVFFTAVLAGSYPAFVLSAFQPSSMLRGKSGNSRSDIILRKGLVAFQFGVSIVLILAAIVAYEQMNFVKSKSLGFEPERLVALDFGSPNTLRPKWNLIKGELEAIPSVEEVFASRMVPGDEAYSWGYKFEGYTENPIGENWMGYYLGPGAVEGFGMELIAGRGFSEKISSDSNAWVLNESAWKLAIERYGEEWKNPIGKRIEYFTTHSGDWNMEKAGTVIGIVKDFHHHGLQEPIEPLVIHNASSENILLRVAEGQIQSTIATLEEKWASFGSTNPFNYQLIDQKFNQLYEKEDQFSQLILVFCGLAIFVACLGLLGLASFTAEMRIKEIGIRKVLGASISSVLWLLSSSFLKLIGLAVVVATPLGYLITNNWLNNFAYRINVGWQHFFISMVATVVIASLAVGYHSLRAATDNPTKSLRYE